MSGKGTTCIFVFPAGIAVIGVCQYPDVVLNVPLGSSAPTMLNADSGILSTLVDRVIVPSDIMRYLPSLEMVCPSDTIWIPPLVPSLPGSPFSPCSPLFPFRRSTDTLTELLLLSVPSA